MSIHGSEASGEGPAGGAPRWGMGDAFAGLAAALVLPSVVVVVALAVVGLDTEDVDTIPLWGVALLQVPLWVVLVGAPWWVSRRKGSGSLRRDFGFVAEWRDIGVGLAAGIGSQIALGILLLPLYDVLGIDQDDVGQAAEDLADRADGVIGVVALFLVAVLGAAIFEELFYRGLVLEAMRRRWGVVPGIAGSSVVFGLTHFQPLDTIALTLFGAVCAWLTVRSGRLGPAIVAHLAFNLTAFLALLA